MADRAAEVASVVQKQRRILAVVTILLAMALVLWLVALSTNHWYSVESDGVYVPKTKRYFLRSTSGIWRTCRTSASANVTQKDTEDALDFFRQCTSHKLFPDSKVQVPAQYLDYRRTIAAFAVISTIVLIMGLAFSTYTFQETRYMYKRLAAAAHVISAACLLIVLEVTISLTDYEHRNMLIRQPPGSTYGYGFSFALAWIAFAVEVIAAITFALFSRKRKKGKAPNERFAIEEEPTIIGR